MKNYVYFAYTDELNNDEEFKRLYQLMPQSRKDKIDKLKSENDKKLSLAAGSLLYLGLHNIGISYSDDIIFTNEYGKAYLKSSGDEEIFFNLSHSKNSVMCVISDSECGCDVEYNSRKDIVERNRKVANRFFCKEEIDALSKCVSDDEYCRLFYRFWTLKESFIKAVGAGMHIPFNEFCISYDNDKPCLNQNVDNHSYHMHEWNFDDEYNYAACIRINSTKNVEFVENRIVLTTINSFNSSQ